jgi:hypothetical protein
MAGWIERLVGDSDPGRDRGCSAALPVVREQVTEARQSLLFLAHLLRSANRVRPRGIAVVEQMLTDGGSVLYTDTARGAVELQVRTALEWLVGEEEADPEAWLSVANPNARQLVSR